MNTISWSYDFEAIGTNWHLSCDSPADVLRSTIVRDIQQTIESYDQTFSRFRADSWVRKIATATGEYKLPDHAPALLQLYTMLYSLTDGKVTPLIGQALVDAGYDEKYSLQAGEIRPVPLFNENVITIKKRSITLHQPLLLDFGAAGKGQLVDLVASRLRAFQVKNYLIDASGDMLVSANHKPIKIGLENPFDTSEAVGIYDLAGGALCGSAINRRRWGKHHHIIDPLTRKPVAHIAATWVHAGSAMVADALATALFFTDPEHLRESFTFSYVVISSSGEVNASQDLAASLFS